jgi:hypothetical protein
MASSPLPAWATVVMSGVAWMMAAMPTRMIVTVRHGGKVQVQEAMSQSSYVSSNDPRLHFGLGPSEIVDIEVRWPLGLVEQHKSVPTNRLITLKEGSGTIDSKPLVPASPLLRRS